VILLANLSYHHTVVGDYNGDLLARLGWAATWKVSDFFSCIGNICTNKALRQSLTLIIDDRVGATRQLG
jgi:hypothetical protein